MTKRILVTGGAGYIGSHTCKALLRAGYEPVTYDNLSKGHADFVKWGPLIVGDLQDTDRLERVLHDYRPEAVMHFAASISVGESIERPFEYFKNNVGGTLSLLEAMTRQQIKRFIFSSTCVIFGDCGQDAISEECLKAPLSPYAHSKMMGEQVLSAMAKRGELQFVALRYFNASGSDVDGEIGQKNDRETHLIPLAILAGLGGKPLNIFGTDYPTLDGTAVRDYVHVSDLAMAHIKALDYLALGGVSDFFNLGMGKGYSVREVVETINKLGIPVQFSISPARKGDAACLVANPQKACKVLKWSVQYDTLESIISTAIAWHGKNR